MNKKTILASLMLIAVLLPGTVFALTPSNATVNYTENSISDVVLNIATFMVAIIAILGIVFLVWGGIQYVTAGGDETAVEKAKTTITYAIIGLFVAAIAYAVETLIFSTLVG